MCGKNYAKKMIRENVRTRKNGIIIREYWLISDIDKNCFDKVFLSF